MGKWGGCLALVVTVALGATQSGFAALIPGGGAGATPLSGLAVGQIAVR